jgi:hypothetical protein
MAICMHTPTMSIIDCGVGATFHQRKEKEKKKKKIPPKKP